MPASKKPKRDNQSQPGTTKANLPVQPGIPEELEAVWDPVIAKAFQGLRPQQQDFLLHYVQTGNAADAYRKAYNPLAKDHLASVSGSQMLASLGLQPILAKLADNKTEALFTVINGYRDMAKATKPEWVQDKDGQWENVGDAADWSARKEAFLGMRKVHGLDAPTEVKAALDVTSRVVQVELPRKKPLPAPKP